MALYPTGKESFLTGTIVCSTADMRWMLCKSAYTYSAAHVFISDLPAATADNGRSTALLSKTTTGGVFDAADISLTATAASACNALILFSHTGSDATARLLAYVSVSAFTPAASQQIDIVHDNGANKIFAI